MSDTEKPAYLDHYPCAACRKGYLACFEFWVVNRKCCKDCAHPDRWTADPAYTADEIADMRRREAAKP